MFICNDRTLKAHSVAWKLGFAWRGNAKLMLVLPWAAAFFAGEKDETWLRTHLPNHADLIINNKPALDRDVLQIAVEVCNV